MRNLEDKLPEKHRATIHARLNTIMMADTRAQAELLTEKLARELSQSYPKAAVCLCDDVARMTAYSDLPKPHWKHLRTTNVIESNFDSVRSRTNVCRRVRSAASATYIVWALMVRRKEHWRRFNGYALLAGVHEALTSRPIALRKAA